MPFTGKATYTAGSDLPEIAEDVSDIISIVSPHETPLLDHLGDPARAASSTMHEWLEDALLPNSDVIDDPSIADPLTDPSFTVMNGDRFRLGDQLRMDGGEEIMLVATITGNTIGVVRQYGGTPASSLADGASVRILGHAALEGDDAPAPRFTSRVRRQNFTQIFTSSVEVSGSQLAAQTIGLADEMDYQKQERLRELLRDLENCVINGVSAQSNPQGNASTRRTMQGIIASLTTNVFTPGAGPIPAGDGPNAAGLTEDILNASLRAVWEQSAASIDTIVCGGYQKRRINVFNAASQRVADEDRYRNLVDVYESDFGVCRVVLSRWVPRDAVLLVDSSRIDVLPLAARSFHFKPLASTGDAESGQVIGEYTMELRNENGHAIVKGLEMG